MYLHHFNWKVSAKTNHEGLGASEQYYHCNVKNHAKFWVLKHHMPSNGHFTVFSDGDFNAKECKDE